MWCARGNLYDFLGGQSIPKLDYDLADGVALTFKKKYYENIERGLRFNKISDAVIDKILSCIKNDKFSEYELRMGEDHTKYLNDEINHICDNITMLGDNYRNLAYEAYDMAVKETNRATYQAMEALIHNLNTMQSRCGAQVDFDLV